MELLTKAADAGSMFWAALDERERLMLAYAGAWVLLVCLLTVQRRSRDRFRHELLAELSSDRQPA